MFLFVLLSLRQGKSILFIYNNHSKFYCIFAVISSILERRFGDWNVVLARLSTPHFRGIFRQALGLKFVVQAGCLGGVTGLVPLATLLATLLVTLLATLLVS